MITLGVVIPVFNRPEYVHAALASVLSQTRLPERIVVVDDGSQPAIVLADQYRADSRITLLRLEKNSGASAARQAGVDALDTSHVAFLDSDDEWFPQKLEFQMRYLETVSDPVMTAVACAWRFRFSSGAFSNTLLPKPASELSKFASGCWFCPGSTVVMSKAALAKIGGFDPQLRRLEDLDLFIRFSREGGRLDVVQELGAIVRKGANAQQADVDTAIDRLSQRYFNGGDQELPANVQRRLSAFLALEKASLAHKSRRLTQLVRHLAKSFVLHPRLQIQLDSWWIQNPQDVHDVECDNRLNLGVARAHPKSVVG